MPPSLPALMSALASPRQRWTPRRLPMRSPRPVAISEAHWPTTRARECRLADRWSLADVIWDHTSNRRISALTASARAAVRRSRRTCANTGPAASPTGPRTSRRALERDGPAPNTRSEPASRLSLVPTATLRCECIFSGAPMGFPAQQIRFCTSRDGTRIAYARCGAGPPLIWVAHWIHHLKFDWDSPVWRPWISALARRHTLIRYDFRGAGLSDRNVDITVEKLGEDFEAVVKASSVERFALVAMTGGARVVMPYVVQNPDCVTRLVLYGTSPSGPLARNARPEQVESMQLQLR